MPFKKPVPSFWKTVQKAASSPKRAGFTVKINENWCKGCEICVKICPKKVFEMGKTPGPKGYFLAIAARPEDCIGCLECELHCPDLAIEIAAAKNKH